VKYAIGAAMVVNEVNIVEDSLQRATSLYGIPLKVVTWNVNGKLDTVEEIRDKMLFPSYYEIPTEDPRLVVIGLQEMVELSAANVIENSVAKVSSSAERFIHWRTVILQVLQEKNPKFCFVGGDSLVGIALMVFCDSDLQSSMRCIQVQKLPRGVGGVLGNKGAVYLRMELMDSSICFISAHFAAHREKVKKRNEDYHAILTAPVFVDEEEAIAASLAPQWNATEQQRLTKLRGEIDRVKRRLNSAAQNYGLQRGDPNHSVGMNSNSVDPISNASGNGGRDRSSSLVDKDINKVPSRPFTAADHDVIVFVGDLNYRIVNSVDISEVYDMIYGHELLRLASYDQLCQEREKNTVFYGFNEGLLTFPPTYQFIPGKDVYDDRKDKKMRCPAWCDRILWRCGRPHKPISPRSHAKVGSHQKDNDLSDDDETLEDADGDTTMRHRSVETLAVEVGSPACPLDTPILSTAPFSNSISCKRKFSINSINRPPDSDDESDIAEDDTVLPRETSKKVLASLLSTDSCNAATTEESRSPLPQEMNTSNVRSSNRIPRPLPAIPSSNSLANAPNVAENIGEIDEDEDGDSDSEQHPEEQVQRTEDIARRLLARNSMRMTDNPEFIDYVRRSSVRLSSTVDELSDFHHIEDANEVSQNSDNRTSRRLTRTSVRMMDNPEFLEYLRRSSLSQSKSEKDIMSQSQPVGAITSLPSFSIPVIEGNIDDIPGKSAASEREVQSSAGYVPSTTSKAEKHVEETIELISYHSCTNIISDHKPVSALMWLRVRRIDYARHEQRVVRCYEPLLHQADVQPLNNKALDLSWHRFRLVTPPAPLFQPELQKQQKLQPQLLRYRHATQVNPFHSSASSLQPNCILLRSMSKEGASAIVELSNRSLALPALLEIDVMSVPSWLSVTFPTPILLPQHSIPITLRNHHVLSTLQLVQDVEQYREYAQENLRSFGKYLNLPPNDPAMQIVAFVRGTITWSVEATASLLGQNHPSDKNIIPTAQQVENQYILKLVEGAARGEVARQKRRNVAGDIDDTVDDEQDKVRNIVGEVNNEVDANGNVPIVSDILLPSDDETPPLELLPRKSSVVRPFLLPVVCSLAMDQSL
jgi:hypothetical protein